MIEIALWFLGIMLAAALVGQLVLRLGGGVLVRLAERAGRKFGAFLGPIAGVVFLVLLIAGLAYDIVIKRL